MTDPVTEPTAQSAPVKKVMKRKKARKPQSRAVAVSKPTPPVPVTLDQQIVLAAADPNVDVGKMKALTDLRRQLRMEAAEEEFNLAMTACQSEMRSVMADAKSDKGKYATLYGVDKALRPIWVGHGFSISFNTADCPLADHTRVLAYVSRGLYTRTYQYDVAVDPKGARGNDVMTKTHAGGSALSYGKRYVLLMIFNVTINKGMDRDDDGRAAGGDLPITKAQLAELIKLKDMAGADVAKFCEVMKVESMADIPASRFEEAKTQLNRKLAAKQRKAQPQSDFPGDR